LEYAFFAEADIAPRDEDGFGGEVGDVFVRVEGDGVGEHLRIVGSRLRKDGGWMIVQTEGGERNDAWLFQW
jgi:hypothetical protein